MHWCTAVASMLQLLHLCCSCCSLLMRSLWHALVGFFEHKKRCSLHALAGLFFFYTHNMRAPSAAADLQQLQQLQQSCSRCSRAATAAAELQQSCSRAATRSPSARPGTDVPALGGLCTRILLQLCCSSVAALLQLCIRRSLYTHTYVSLRA